MQTRVAVYALLFKYINTSKLQFHNVIILLGPQFIQFVYNSFLTVTQRVELDFFPPLLEKFCLSDGESFVGVSRLAQFLGVLFVSFSVFGNCFENLFFVSLILLDTGGEINGAMSQTSGQYCTN